MITFAAVAGILVSEAFGLPDLLSVGLLTTLVLAVVVVCQRQPCSRPVLAGFLVLAVFAQAAALRHSFSQRSYRAAGIMNIADELGRPTILQGIVDSPVVLRRHPLAGQLYRKDQSPWQTQISVLVQRMKVSQDFEPFRGRALVVVDDRMDDLRPGDAIQVFGSMRRFGPPTNPGERDLRDVYRRRQLHVRVDVDTSDQLVLLPKSPDQVRFFNRWWLTISRPIAAFGVYGRDVLLHHTSESAGPLAVALVIGQREFVDPETRDLLLVTGTAHLLSVSGLHLAIIVVLASWSATLLQLRPNGRILWILSICFLYTAITGGRPPVMRAAVLVATFMFAIWIRRPSQPINTLSLAALILIFWNPENVFSVGVQLSFLAVATLVLCGRKERSSSPAIEQALRQEERLQSLVESSRSWPVFAAHHVAQWLGQLIWFSGCVTAISMPLIWHQFHVISPISIATNVVLGPLLFVALASGVATVVFGWLPLLGGLFGTICSVSLSSMRWIIELAAALDGGHFWLPAPPIQWVLAFYISLALSLLLPVNRISRALRCGWIVAWMGIAYFIATTPAELEEGSVEATFVDVGHGTSVVLRFAKDDVWLYDCGRLGNDTGSSRDIDATLWSLGVTRLSGIILSHADADHFNALPGLLRRFSVDRIVTPPGMLAEQELALDAIRKAIELAEVEVIELSDGNTIRTSDHALQVLHPPAVRLPGSDNANSLVIRVDCGGEALILPGDLEPPGTHALIQHQRPPPGGVLMAPHHGSLTMDAKSVLEWSRPRETVVSGGRRAGRPEIQEMLSQTGSSVHVTHQSGAVRVTIQENGEIDVRSWSGSSEQDSW
ncbi:MAG: ComEC/Rec2 family competence protein [Rubripirellula sp.]